MDPASILSLSTPVVIRRSGIWNSRWPLHSLFRRLEDIGRDYSLLTLAITRTRHDADHIAPGDSASASVFMHARISGPVASKAWNGYRRYWRQSHALPDGQPSIADLEHDLGPVLYSVRELAVVRVASAFETFVQCWALNMLLASLERRGEWTSAELDLARQLSPVHSHKRPAPGVPGILRCYSSVATALEKLPHVAVAKAGGGATDEPAYFGDVDGPVRAKPMGWFGRSRWSISDQGDGPFRSVSMAA